MCNWFNQWVKMSVASSHCRVHAVPDYEGKGQYAMMSNSHYQECNHKNICTVINNARNVHVQFSRMLHKLTKRLSQLYKVFNCLSKDSALNMVCIFGYFR